MERWILNEAEPGCGLCIPSLDAPTVITFTAALDNFNFLIFLGGSSVTCGTRSPRMMHLIKNLSCFLLCLTLFIHACVGGSIYGISLTSSYGYVVTSQATFLLFLHSLTCSDSTVYGYDDYGYVPGNKIKLYGGPKYEAMMRRFSLPSSQHFSSVDSHVLISGDSDV